MIRATLTFLLIFLYLISFSQNRRFKYRQYVPLKYKVTDTYTIKKGDTVKLEKGYIIKEEYEKEVDKKKYTFTLTETVKDTSGIKLLDKKQTYDRRLKGKAQAYIKEGDYGKIYLDYYLTTKTYFPAGTKLDFYTDDKKTKSEILTKSKQYAFYNVPDDILNEMILKKKQIEKLQNQIDSTEAIIHNGSKQFDFSQAEKFLTEERKTIASSSTVNSCEVKKQAKKDRACYKKELEKIYKNGTVKEYLWAAYSKEQIKRKTDEGDITYYKKYPEDGYIKLQNREYIKLKFLQAELAALTIPFKYRFQQTENNETLRSVATADVNVATYFGITCGSLTYKNKIYEKIKPQGQAISAGGFLGFNILTLDSVSTSLQGIEYFTDSRSTVALTTGFGLMYNFYDFNIGLFYGWDFGIGSQVTKWNYHGQPWIGFGLGYNITMLGKKED